MTETRETTDMDELEIGDWENGPSDVPDIPDTDFWGQDVVAFTPIRPVGAGEMCECTNCEETRRHIAMYASTAPDTDSNRWEEYYLCACGATGIFRVDETRPYGEQRKWIGAMRYPGSV